MNVKKILESAAQSWQACLNQELEYNGSIVEADNDRWFDIANEEGICCACVAGADYLTRTGKALGPFLITDVESFLDAFRRGREGMMDMRGDLSLAVINALEEVLPFVPSADKYKTISSRSCDNFLVLSLMQETIANLNDAFN